MRYHFLIAICFSCISALISNLYAQVNIYSDEITYRTSSGRGETTTHNGHFEVYANNNNDIIMGQNTSTSATDKIGVRGYSRPVAYYGVGVRGEGCYKGVTGSSSCTGTGSRYGVEGYAYGGSSANYGIYGSAGGSNSWAGYFSGNVYCTGSYQSSDKNLKKNIKNLEGSLEKVMKLKAKTYEYDSLGNPEMGLSEGTRIGLIAQDVEEIIPEVVKDIPIAKPEMDEKEKKNEKPVEYVKAINYNEIIPVLINAIQEQQKEIEDLKKLIPDYY